MKTFFATTLCLLLFSNFIYSQKQQLTEPFAFYFNGHIKLFLFDEKKDDFEYETNGNSTENKPNKIKRFKYGEETQFYRIGTYYEKLTNEQSIKYYKMTPVPFKYKILVESKDYEKYGRSINDMDYINGSKLYRINNINEDKLQKNDTRWFKENDALVSVQDRNKIFLIESSRFDEMENKDFIFKRYVLWDWDVDYGAQLSLPFKLRPEINDDNMRITPEINLGGYVSSRLRIDRRKNRYLHLPMFSAGVSGIGINSNNKIDESTNTGDGLVMATTFTGGVGVELDSFQLAFIIGWDKASGEIGKEWQYNGRPWYSFGVGFTFLSKQKDEKQ
ncbi:hypothetical protein [Costertonia aggregata]|uniref:Outer membrane protein beta-barrel domain-containing protein n=1 Tax=Costertonia aggregata TaxID=343403 RepID=A0A7H9ARI3_9FLAO|nr:hypothetical protein [Costertonia aggregata]QLG46029.1 hypothetical protein HYG79_11970 [Costertonia aggregata]